MIDPVLKIGPHVTAVPVVHGSGDFAWEVRRIMGAGDFDCVAVPLPESFQAEVEKGILALPQPGIVVQDDYTQPLGQWQDGGDGDDDDDGSASYVPIDPCQAVIAALRTAMGERLPRYFIDQETSRFEVQSRLFPDAYALKKVSLEQWASAVLPHLAKPKSEQWENRICYMAQQLRELSVDYKRILFLVNVLDWPWVRQAFLSDSLSAPENEVTQECESFGVTRDTHYFLLGEIPFITNLYERARAELADDAQLSIDGIKELLMAARRHYKLEYGNRARKVTPRTLSTCLKYIRNLTLIEHRMSPQLLTVITAAKQVVGDGYALSVLEIAREYDYMDYSPSVSYTHLTLPTIYPV